MTADVLVISPFRKPTFRHAVSPWYPGEEPWDSPPFTAAGEIEAAGLETSLLMLQTIFSAYDDRRDREDLRDLLDSSRARTTVFVADPFIGSRSTATLYGMRIVAELLGPDTVLGVCGRLATTAWPTLFAQLPRLDFAVIGEADAVIGATMKEVLSQAPEVSELTSPAIVSRQQAGGPETALPARVDSLDEVALPAYHLAHLSLKAFQERAAPERRTSPIPLSLRTSLGCRFSCKFCAGVPFWREYRRKSPARIEAELSAMADRLPADTARLAFLEDEVFTLDPAHVRDVTAVLADRQIVLDGLYTHSSMVTAEIATLLKPITRAVFLGMDSSDDEVLKEMGKGQRFDTVMAAVQTAAAAGLPVHLEWIVGSPAETAESTARGLIAIFNLLHTGAVESVNTYTYCPHPGTAYADEPAEYGLSVIGDLESMQESGGYPAAATAHLSRDQIFVAYLLSQVVIKEALAVRGRSGSVASVRKGDTDALVALLEEVGSDGGRGVAR